MQTRRQIPVLAGRYALEEELGRSGTGIAWTATDSVLRRRVTIKLINPELADDPAFAESLRDQVRKVASLSAPTLARLLDTGEQDGIVFLVREHVEGTSARALLDDRGVLAVHEAVGIAARVLDGLATAHDAGVLHLNLELDDVLIEPGGEVRVTDIGIGAAVCAARPAEALHLLGGEGLSPEQRSGGPVDARADVYAAGVLLFELLTGEVPRGRRSLRELRPDVPAGLDRAVASALSPDPDGRLAAARSFAEAIAPFAGAAEVAPRAADVPGARRRERWLRTWVAPPLLIAIGAAALIGAGLWLGRLEIGGPLGIRPAQDEERPSRSPAAAAPVSVRPAAVSVLDPFGDGAENDSNLELALDGDVGTAWRSENYFDVELRKPGVGLVFDLGRTMELTAIRLVVPHAGYTFRLAIGDDPDGLLDHLDAQRIAEEDTSASVQGTGRYVLLWITSVVDAGDGNRAEVAEFSVLAAADA